MMLRGTYTSVNLSLPRVHARPCRNRVVCTPHSVLMSTHMGRGHPPARREGGPSREMRMFNKVTQDATATFDPVKDGPPFFKAMQEFRSEPDDLLYRLVKPQDPGLKRLRSALSICDSAGTIKTHLLPLLDLLACDALGGRTYRAPLRQVLQSIYEVPGLMDCVLDTLERNSRLYSASASSPLGDVTPLGWFLIRVALEVPGARSDPLLPRWAAALKSHGGGAAAAATQLEVLLAPQEAAEEGSGGSSRNGGPTAAERMAQRVVGIQDLRQYAGGRHDNDKLDYRDIQIMVTSEEALCPEPPFLPASQDNHATLSSQPQAALLDRQFRLLREDMVGPLRVELHALVCLVTPGRPLLFATVARRDPAELAHEQPIVGLSFDQDQDAEKVLAHMACGPLPHGTVLVQVSSNFLSSKPVLKCLQQMSGVPLDKELVDAHHPAPTTYLDANRSALDSELQQLAPSLDPSQLTAMQQALASRVALIQGPPGTGKTFTGVKLCDLILRHSSETILCVCYTNHALDQFLEALLGKGITDIVRIGGRSKSQRLEPYNLRQLAAAAATAGTSGYNTAESRRMFDLHRELEDLKREVAQLSRVLVATGSLPAPPSAASSSNGRGGAGQQRPPPPAPGSAAQHAWLQREQKLQQEEQQARQKRQAAAAARRGQTSSVDEEEEKSREWQFNEWRDGIRPLLEEEHPGVVRQLTIPAAMTHTGPSYLWWRWLSGARDKGSVDSFLQKAAARASGGWQQAKPGNKASSSKGKAASTSTATPSPPLPPAVSSAMTALDTGAAVDFDDDQLLADIWAFPRALRYALARHWRSQLRGRWAEELQGVLQKASKVLGAIRDLRDSGCEPLLAKARVIGCTTTGAALHKELLTGSKVAPRVVMIEEAGELLEAHVLTSLSPATKHLIMIGDHKQLRPKVEHYPLSVASGRGYGLDVSLFQRLVESGMPHTTLAVQHRMHPDISRLIRHTYPKLTDHTSVSARPPLKGVAGRVLFLDHTQPELQESQRAAGKWRANAEHQSKVNLHEVGLTVATVKFLLQQGYQPGQLVVLTPYLGQLLELQRELSKTVEVVLADMDMQELRRAALPAALEDLRSSASKPSSSSSSTPSSSSNSKPSTGGVRVATIDNFQGEEADVVVASLVRSNSARSVGFLRAPERINVLLSRARCGLILVGNATMLRNASSHDAQKHWGVVLDQLETAGAILPGLPAVCQQHGRSLPLLDSVEAFEEYSPQGGCQEPCQELLPCGHACKLRCHAYDPGHVNQRCVEQVLVTCSAGHVTMGPCYSSKDSCSVCWQIQKVVEEERKKQDKLEAEEQRKRNELEVKRGKLAAEEERTQAQLRALQQQVAARKAVVEQELAAAKAKKQLELEKRAAAADVATWEDQARKQAAADLEQMEEEVKLKADIEAEAKKLAKKLRKEQLQEEAKLRAVQRELEELEQKGQQELQDIENRRQRAAVEAETKAADVEAGARLSSHQIMQAAKVQVQLQQLCKEGAPGLPTFQGWLLQAAGLEDAGSASTASSSAGAILSSAAAADVADALDVALSLPQLGQQLLSYVSLKQGSVQALPPLPPTARRALSSMGKGDWVTAMQVLEPSEQDSGSNSSASDKATVAALKAICQGHLQLHVSAKEGLASNRPATAFALPGMRIKSRTGGLVPQTRAPVRSPLQHLAAAVNYSNLATEAGKASSSVTPAQLSTRSKLSAQAAGEALAFLLHPANGSSSYPGTLLQRAADILQQQGAAAFTSSTADAMAAVGGGGSSGRKEDWLERAGSSKALRELAGWMGSRAPCVTWPTRWH